jgi:hypothetical protein
MRIDPANEIAGVRLNAWVSAIVCILSIGWFLWLGRRGSPYQPGKAPADGGGAVTTPDREVPDRVGSPPS